MSVPLFDFMATHSCDSLTKGDEGDEGYDINEAREAFITKVLEAGNTIVYPALDELQIDIDSDDHYATFLTSMECVCRNWDDAESITVECHPSQSGLPRRHITLTLPRTFTPWQRIALQACFGSDPLRELLSATRLIKGDIHPTLFVEVGLEKQNSCIPPL